MNGFSSGFIFSAEDERAIDAMLDVGGLTRYMADGDGDCRPHIVLSLRDAGSECDGVVEYDL